MQNTGRQIWMQKIIKITNFFNQNIKKDLQVMKNALKKK
jgi:hypothetical protein